MNSRFWRTIIVSLLVSAALEFGIALAVSVYFNNRDQLFYAILLLAAMWAIQIILWAKNTTVATIYYYLMGKKVWIADVESALRVSDFPIYSDYRPDAVTYFSTVARDERSTADQVLYAAGSLGQIELLKLQKPTAAWRMMAVCEAALDNYLRNPSPIQNRRM